MWYQNIGSIFFRFVTKHTCDSRTDRQNFDPKTALAQLLRAVKMRYKRVKCEQNVSIPLSLKRSIVVRNFGKD